MADLNARDAKLVQYLNEAYGKEKQLETALQAHILMADARKPYKKRLQQHLKETKSHGREVSRRIKALGGKVETVSVPGPEAVGNVAQAAQNIANRAAAAAQGPLHAVRGTGEQEKLLKNAKTEYQDEAEEIATYSAIEALAGAVGDKETAKLAKSIIRDESRMRDFLGRLIPQLSKAVATSEVPAALRSTGRRSSRSRGTARRSSSASSGRRKTATRSGARKASSSRSTGRKTSSARSGARKASSSRSSGRKTTASRSGARKASSSRSSGRKTAASRSTARKTTASRSTGRKTASRSTGRSTSSRAKSGGRSTSRRSGARSTARRGSSSRRS